MPCAPRANTTSAGSTFPYTDQGSPDRRRATESFAVWPLRWRVPKQDCRQMSRVAETKPRLPLWTASDGNLGTRGTNIPHKLARDVLCHPAYVRENFEVL